MMMMMKFSISPLTFFTSSPNCACPWQRRNKSKVTHLTFCETQNIINCNFMSSETCELLSTFKTFRGNEEKACGSIQIIIIQATTRRSEKSFHPSSKLHIQLSKSRECARNFLRPSNFSLNNKNFLWHFQNYSHMYTSNVKRWRNVIWIIF